MQNEPCLSLITPTRHNHEDKAIKTNMNTVTFNKPFDAFRDSADFRGGCDLADIIAKSPIIDWAEVSTQDFDVKQSPDAAFPNGCPRTPFQAFRVNGLYTDTVGNTLKFKAWVNQIPHEKLPALNVMIQCLEVNGIKVATDSPLNRALLVCTSMFSEGILGKWWAEVAVYSMDTGRVFVPDIPKDSIWLLAVEWVQKLCIDFQNPHLHLVKKSQPNPGGKSVEWQKTREHYVLIHKSHPANKKEPSTRRLVIDGDTINRSAHSRRAHYRMLSSPVFRHKMGQRVWVRSSWCGPKEWTDRSGQIYRIVDRN